jgi:hypothetical protein
LAGFAKVRLKQVSDDLSAKISRRDDAWVPVQLFSQERLDLHHFRLQGTAMTNQWRQIARGIGIGWRVLGKQRLGCVDYIVNQR